MNIIHYILISTVCLSITYAFYLLIFKHEGNFKQLRIYLLTSILLSLLIPLNSYRINLNPLQNLKTIENSVVENSFNPSLETVINESANNHPASESQTTIKLSETDWSGILKSGYFIIMAVFIFRMTGQLFILIINYYKSERTKLGKYVIIRNNRFKNTFSFFNWIFVHSDYSSNEDFDQIIAHEKIHASQYHTFDLILIELLAAVMWFNPLIWMMRNTMQLVHEYLADEGALSTGIDKLKYQALLLNQVTEEKLIRLSSSFNHSLIKKRMIMMTKSKFNQRTKLRILALVPVAIILFLGVACINGQNKNIAVTAIEPVRMNVLYVGVDNPIKIAASGYESSELTVTIDNGTITGKNGEYNVRPKQPGTANVVVTNSNGKEIQRTAFRAKIAPDPVASIKTPEGYKTNGLITKKELLDAKGIEVTLNNFDFDMKFTVDYFVLSFTVPNKFVIIERVSKSDKFTEEQINDIKSLIKFQKVTIEAITAVGPDGIKRKLNPMVFLISED